MALECRHCGGPDAMLRYGLCQTCFASATAEATAPRDREIHRVRRAIAGLLGDGADESLWPPGTHYADALTAYVGRLISERDDARSDLADARREAHERQQAVAALRSRPEKPEMAYYGKPISQLDRDGRRRFVAHVNGLIERGEPLAGKYDQFLPVDLLNAYWRAWEMDRCDVCRGRGIAELPCVGEDICHGCKGTGEKP